MNFARTLLPKQKTPTNSLEAAGFTLIELLVVIAIIALLAGLGLPAISGALRSGKRTQALNDVSQISSAVKSYQMEYGKLPPEGEEIITLIASNTSANPKGIVFFEAKTYKSGSSGWNGSDYLDVWGNPYVITLDDDYDNKVSVDVGSGEKDYFTTVVVQSSGGSTNNSPKDIISNVE